MSVIDDIKKGRESLITEEQKTKILKNIKCQLLSNESALIWGASHFSNQRWFFPDNSWQSCEAPYKYHAAISTWLEGLGFKTNRHYNKGGVEQGLEVRI